MGHEEAIAKLSKDLASHIANESGRLEFISNQLAEIKALQSAFFILPETHYNDHKKLREIADTYDKFANRIGSVVISLIVAGVLGWASLSALFPRP